jgi:hypothetical protein
MNQKYINMARKVAPQEYEPFAAVACEIMERHKIKITPESVTARLKALGRDRESIIERHKRYGKAKRTPKQNQQVGQVEKMAA